MTKRQKFFSALGRFFKDFFTKNIILKIVVVLFAILLWGFVITEEDPEYVKRVSKVSIKILGQEDLLKEGWIVDSVNNGSPDDLKTDVDVKCKISKHDSLTESALSNCFIDLSEQTVPSSTDLDYFETTYEVRCEPASGFGEVTGLSNKQVVVRFAKTKTIKNYIVEVVPTGANPEGLMISLPKQVKLASLTGKQSEIERIGTVKVMIDLSQFAGSEPGFYPAQEFSVQFYEKGSNTAFTEIGGDAVKVDVDVTIYAYKKVPVRVVAEGSDEFEKAFEIKEPPRVEGYDPEEGEFMVGLRASQADTLNAITEIRTEKVLPRTQAGEQAFNLKLILPDKNVTLVDASDTVKVTLNVSEKMTEWEIPVRIDYSETKPGVHLSSSQRQTVRARIRSTVRAKEEFNASELHVSMQISNYLQGAIRLPLVLEYTGDTTKYHVRLVDPLPDSDGVTYLEIKLEADPQQDNPDV